MMDSGAIGLILGLFIGILVMLAIYYYMSSEREKFRQREEKMIDNLSKIIDRLENSRRK